MNILYTAYYILIYNQDYIVMNMGLLISESKLMIELYDSILQYNYKIEIWSNTTMIDIQLIYKP
jgi:hypothetical protein